MGLSYHSPTSLILYLLQQQAHKDQSQFLSLILMICTYRILAHASKTRTKPTFSLLQKQDLKKSVTVSPRLYFFFILFLSRFFIHTIIFFSFVILPLFYPYMYFLSIDMNWHTCINSYRSLVAHPLICQCAEVGILNFEYRISANSFRP